MILQLWQWCPEVYHRPGYWPTTDGVMPYHLAWMMWKALASRHAVETHATLRAIGMALGGAKDGRDVEALLADIYPHDGAYRAESDG